MFILIGIVVNNGIILIDHINQMRAEGLARKEAILETALHHMRPILMTAGTTVLGLIPLSVGKTLIGGDGPPYFPMARAIMGGLIFSTVVTLTILPTILDNLNIWREDGFTQGFGERNLCPKNKKLKDTETELSQKVLANGCKSNDPDTGIGGVDGIRWS